MKPRLGVVGWVAGKKSTLEKEKRGQSKQIFKQTEKGRAD